MELKKGDQNSVNLVIHSNGDADPDWVDCRFSVIVHLVC